MGFRSQFAGQATASGTSMSSAITVGAGSTVINLLQFLDDDQRVRVFRANLSLSCFMRAAAAAESQYSAQLNLYETGGAFDQIGQLDVEFGEGSGGYANVGLAIPAIDLPRGVVLPNGSGLQLQNVLTLRAGSAAQAVRATGTLALFFRIEPA